jgi:uncharacterized membrane protein YeaQ/YmgE (transglycosylase-associated protein family)
VYFVLWLIALGTVGGWLSGKLMKGTSYGRVMDIVMGLGGAVGAGIIASFLDLRGIWGFTYATASALVGAVLLTLLTGFANGKEYAD